MPCVTNKIREMDKKYKSKKYKKDMVIAQNVYFAFSQMKIYLDEFKVGKDPMSYDAVEVLFGGISCEELKEVITVPCGSKGKKVKKVVVKKGGKK